MEELKELVMAACRQMLENRIMETEGQYHDLSLSLETETKSSVGDKHETARARMQTEQDNLSRQMKEIRNQLDELQSIVTEKRSMVTKGSLVSTNRGIFFIGPALGKVKVNTQEVFVISLQSPIGKLMAGKSEQSTFTLNGMDYQITSIH